MNTLPKSVRAEIKAMKPNVNKADRRASLFMYAIIGGIAIFAGVAYFVLGVNY